MGWAFIFVFYPSLTLGGKSNQIKIDIPEKLAAWGTQEEEKHNMINHCDRPINLLSDTDTVY